MTKQFRTTLPLVMFGLMIISSCQNRSASKTLLRLVPVPTSHGWAYKITRNEQPWIYQEFIPAVPGYQSFHTKEEAMQVGKLVMQKLQQQQLPAVSVFELDSMKIHIQL